MAEKAAPPSPDTMLSGLVKLLHHHHLASRGLYLCLGPMLALLLLPPRLPALPLPDLCHPVAAALTLALLAAALYATCRPRPVYLLDFCCYKPGKAHMGARSTVLKQLESGGTFTAETVAFQRKILERCGIGDSAYFPTSLLRRPVDIRYATAREEAETALFGAVDELLRATGLAAREVSVLVVNCSTYNPNPGYTDMIVNRYKMRGDVVCYNLGGMGCSAGLIAIDLVKNLLQVLSPSLRF